MLAARSCISWLAASDGSERRDAVEGALRAAPPSASPSRSAALMRSHWRFTSDAVRASASPNTCGMAADDLRGDRGLDVGEVEDAFLRRELGVQDDLQPQVAELAGQLRRGAGSRTS